MPSFSKLSHSLRVRKRPIQSISKHEDSDCGEPDPWDELAARAAYLPPSAGTIVDKRARTPRVHGSRGRILDPRKSRSALGKQLVDSLANQPEVDTHDKAHGAWDTQQKCVTNLAATVVRQDQQIKELRAQIRQLEVVGQGHLRSTSDIYSDSTVMFSSASSEISGSSSPSNATTAPSEFTYQSDTGTMDSYLAEAELELKRTLAESRDLLSTVTVKSERRFARPRKDLSMRKVRLSRGSSISSEA